MSDKENFQKVVFLIAKQLHCEANSEANTITEISLLTSDLGADSLDLAEIALMIKDEFGHALSDADLQKAATVGDICKILNQVHTKESV